MYSKYLIIIHTKGYCLSYLCVQLHNNYMYLPVYRISSRLRSIPWCGGAGLHFLHFRSLFQQSTLSIFSMTPSFTPLCSHMEIPCAINFFVRATARNVCAYMLCPHLVPLSCACMLCPYIVNAYCVCMLWPHVVPSCCALMLCPHVGTLRLNVGKLCLHAVPAKFDTNHNP